MEDWQPADTAPTTGELFIAWDNVAYQLLFTMHWDGEDFLTRDEQWSGSFSHWMPLPNAPEAA